MTGNGLAMGVAAEIAQDAQAADLRAPLSGMARDLAKSFRSGTATDLLVLQQQKRQALRRCEAQIASREKFASAPECPRSLRGHRNGSRESCI